MRSGKHAGDGGNFPARCDSCREIGQRPAQTASGIAPADCGCWHLLLPFSLHATNTSPWLEQWSARGNTTPTWRRQPIRRVARTDIARHRRARTLEQKRCRWKERKRAVQGKREDIG